jgi:cobalt-zinc-cadmium efflux system protein
LVNVFKNLRKTLSLFLQGVPEDVNLQSVEEEILKLDNVISSHHTHVWSLDGEHHVLTTHVVIPDTVRREEVLHLKDEVRKITEKMNFYHTTVEVEFSDEDCRMKEES